MSEALLGKAVDACEALTSSVEGHAGKINEALADAINILNSKADKFDRYLPRICITNNPFLDFDSETNLPTGLYIHSDVTVELYETISGSPSSRTPEQLSILDDIESDLGVDIRKNEYYQRGFNIVKLSWKSLASSDWLAFPSFIGDYASSLPTQNKCTVGAFVKVLSGEISGYWGTGAERGVWHFGSSSINPSDSFGRYTHAHPARKSVEGEVLVALPFATTGYIGSANHWFPQISIKDLK